jgi:hypothetical protein
MTSLGSPSCGAASTVWALDAWALDNNPAHKPNTSAAGR